MTIILLIIGVALISLFLVGAFKEKERSNVIDDEINALKEEAKKVKANNDLLEERITYFQSSDYQEMEAKKKLNLKKEGEEVVVIQSSQKDEPVSESVEESRTPEIVDNRKNYQKWWDYLFNQ